VGDLFKLRHSDETSQPRNRKSLYFSSWDLGAGNDDNPIVALK
jgi:hypothetical protein